MLLRSCLFALVALAATPTAGAATPLVAPSQQAKARTSPFEMVRWDGETPQVLVGGAWWKFESLDGVACDQIL